MSLMTKRIAEGFKSPDPETRRKASEGLKTALKQKAVTPAQFDLGDLFSEVFGYGEFVRLRESRGNGVGRVMEAAGAVSSDAFLSITQQFFYQTFLDAYDIPEQKFRKLIPTRATKFKFERVPGITHIGDENLVVRENQEFPTAGVTEDYIDTPETRKRGMQIPVTKEAVFFDQTGLLMDRIAKHAEWYGVNEEKRAIDCIVDAGETAGSNEYRYRWLGNTIATYGDNSGNHNWDNLAASNTLLDYTSIETAWKLLREIVDPYTGEPQNVSIKHICVPPALEFKVPFALRGMVKKVMPGYATSANPTSSEQENPVGSVIGNIETYSSQLFRSRSGSDSTWFIGDVSKAFAQYENWPLQVLSLGSGSQMEFTHDIVAAFRVDKRSTFVTLQPRAMVKCT